MTFEFVSANITRDTAVCSPVRGRYRTLSRREVRLGDGLLGQWQNRNRQVTIPHAIEQMRAAGNLTNLQRLLGEVEGEYQGRYPFLDTDIYKTLEGIAYEIGSGEADGDAIEFFDESCRLLARVQRSDGYLNAFFQDPKHPNGPWSDLSWGHEMYNLGHLIQAAVAAKRQMDDDRLLKIACRFADHVIDKFGPEGPEVTGDHPIIEMALVELYRTTGDEKYLNQASLFVERRGRQQFSTKIFTHEYFQDEYPIRELPTVTGHAVRMTYLAAGVTDLAHETQDESLLEPMQRLWLDMVNTKLYITGGLGSRHSDEAIGDRYELPAERAYAESCAAIATMQWAWRLFLRTGEAHYLDVFENVLYNAYAVGISAHGDKFFYDNPLQRRPDHTMRTGAEAEGELLRRGWFGCPCCPPNIVRWMSELQDHIAVSTDEALVIANYTDAHIHTDALDVRMQTAYPWNGDVIAHITDVKSATDREYALQLRVPQWTRDYTVHINDTAHNVTAENGWITIRRQWATGDRLSVNFPMRAQMHGSHAYLDASRGSAAVRRGPMVYCLEQEDSQYPVDDVVITPQDVDRAQTQVLTHIPDVSNQAVSLHLTVNIRPPQSNELYPVVTVESPGATDGSDAERVQDSVKLVPYYLWGNRQAQAMRVWLRRF